MEQTTSIAFVENLYKEVTEIQYRAEHYKRLYRDFFYSTCLNYFCQKPYREDFQEIQGKLIKAGVNNRLLELCEGKHYSYFTISVCRLVVVDKQMEPVKSIEDFITILNVSKTENDTV